MTEVDIVDRLRSHTGWFAGVANEAADEIERPRGIYTARSVYVESSSGYLLVKPVHSV